ncbi:MAG: hypothetical protein ABI634_07165 [Acidobacteriota bacterium]
MAIEQAAQTLSPANPAGLLPDGRARDELVADSLAIALAVVVRDKLVRRAAQVALAQRHDAVQTLRHNRPPELLDMGGVGRLKRGAQHPDARILQALPRS